MAGLFSGLKEAPERASRLNDKTNVKTLDGDLAPGTEPTHAIFTGDYFLSEIKAYLRGTLGNANAEEAFVEASGMPEEKADEFILEVLKQTEGNVIEVNVWEKEGRADKDGKVKTFTNVHYLRPVTTEELREQIGAMDRKRFGLLQ